MCSRSNLFKQRNCSIIKLETNLSSWVIIQSRRGLVNPLSWGDCRLHLNWPRLCRSTLRVSDKVWLIFSCTNYFHFIPTEHDLAGRLDLLLRTIFLQQQQLLFGSLVVGFIRSSLKNDVVPTSQYTCSYSRCHCFINAAESRSHNSRRSQNKQANATIIMQWIVPPIQMDCETLLIKTSNPLYAVFLLLSLSYEVSKVAPASLICLEHNSCGNSRESWAQ